LDGHPLATGESDIGPLGAVIVYLLRRARGHGGHWREKVLSDGT
jgi:hypothetical protein